MPVLLFLVGLMFGGLSSLYAGDCLLKPYRIEGQSMAPFLAAGSTVTATMGEPACWQPLTKGDIVLLRTARDTRPYIKGIHAIPGDTLNISGTHIFVNGALNTNAEGKPYVLSPAKARMLQLYTGKGGTLTLPADTYLLLGEDVHGTNDSTVFGLIHIKAIIGKVSETK